MCLFLQQIVGTPPTRPGIGNSTSSPELGLLPPTLFGELDR